MPNLPTPFTRAELARYAEVALDRCLDLRPGELLLLGYQPEHRPLAVAVARAAFERGLSVDEGGRRLGEVALVDASSRIGQRGRLYWNTLLDENQACHVALGLGFSSCRRDGTASEDLNSSRTHIDVMIGGPEVQVTGVTASDERVPLIVDGVWRPA
jgi:leucyl aminopeptidase (aminopeptidase T)